MMYKTIVKILMTILYIVLVIFVPNMPSHYTFIITTMAYILTISTSSLIIQFLNTRPSVQKTLLNRLLAMLVLIGTLGTTRCFLMSFIACWFNSSLNNFVNNHQYFSTIVLPLNSYSVLVGGGLSFLVCRSIPTICQASMVSWD